MGDIVSFYSFKGGSGRSTCLSNVAFELAKRGAKVGCMDFDLSAPGLHMIYEIGPNRRARTKSIHDYLDPNKPTTDLGDYVLDIEKSYKDTHFDGSLLMMPGDINPRVASEMAGDSNDTYINIQQLIREFETVYDLDYVFLDSRSGISNQAIPMFQSANYLLTFSKWTHQHKLGTYELLNWVGDTCLSDGDYFDDLIGIASNVPGSVSESDVSEWVEDELPQFVGDSTLIHESEALKKEEQIVIDTMPESSISSEYRAIADLIQTL